MGQAVATRRTKRRAVRAPMATNLAGNEDLARVHVCKTQRRCLFTRWILRDLFKQRGGVCDVTQTQHGLLANTASQAPFTITSVIDALAAVRLCS